MSHKILVVFFVIIVQLASVHIGNGLLTYSHIFFLFTVIPVRAFHAEFYGRCALCHPKIQAQNCVERHIRTCKYIRKIVLCILRLLIEIFCICIAETDVESCECDFKIEIVAYAEIYAEFDFGQIESVR